MKRIVHTSLSIVAAAIIGAIPMVAAAQSDYPNKPVRIVLGVAAGGLSDVTARVLAKYLSPRLGQPIIIDNKPGANTTIGANAARTAAPDGYTLFYGSMMSPSPIFVKNGGVDFATQMKPVSNVLSAPWYLLVNSQVPAKTMQTSWRTRSSTSCSMPTAPHSARW